MFEENKNKNKALTIMAIAALLISIIGVSFAAYYWQFTGQSNTISTGTVSMSLLESVDSINIQNALPMGDTEGKALVHGDGSSGVFDFAVTTYASGAPGNITYTISVTKAEVDTGYTALQDSQVKIYLVAFEGNTETQVMAPVTVDNVITSGNTGTLTFDAGKTSYLTHVHTTANTTQTQKYRLRMWVDGQVDASSWTSSTKLQYKLKVNANGQLAS